MLAQDGEVLLILVLSIELSAVVALVAISAWQPETHGRHNRRLAVVLWGTTVFGFIHVMTEYAIVIRFSDANWEIASRHGYLTVATITISATRRDQFRHRGTTHPSRGRRRAAVSEAHRACARAGAHDRRGRARAPACSERPADPRSSQTLVQVPQSSELKNSPRFRVIETRPPGFTSPLAMSELNPPLSSFIFSQ
jgi:hypothetical protein